MSEVRIGDGNACGKAREGDGRDRNADSNEVTRPDVRSGEVVIRFSLVEVMG